VRMLADLALRREAAHWQTSETTRPICPECGRALIRRGRQPRQLKTHGDQPLTLTRSYGYCPNCRRGFFPPR
jgi:ribosomal protein L34E